MKQIKNADAPVSSNKLSVQSESPDPDVVAQRRKAMVELREIARRLNIQATHEEIKGWIEEGRH